MPDYITPEVFVYVLFVVMTCGASEMGHFVRSSLREIKKLSQASLRGARPELSLLLRILLVHWVMQMTNLG